MKYYYNEIKNVENSGKNVEEFIKYIRSDNNDYIENIKSGVTLIPTAHTIKQVKLKMILQDKYLLRLDNAIKYSEAFYYNLIKLVIESKYQKVDYNYHFNKIAILYGTKFIEETSLLKKEYHSPAKEELVIKKPGGVFKRIYYIISLFLVTSIMVSNYTSSAVIFTVILLSFVTYMVKTFSEPHFYHQYDINGNDILAQKYRNKLINKHYVNN